MQKSQLGVKNINTYTKMSIVLPHSEEFSFEGVSVDTYFTFRLTTTGTCGFSRKTSLMGNCRKVIY
jgi:hypothetical protein